MDILLSDKLVPVFFLFPSDIATLLSETERQKTPGSLYHLQQKQISSVSICVFSIHRSDLLLLNMVQGACISVSDRPVGISLREQDPQTNQTHLLKPFDKKYY